MIEFFETAILLKHYFTEKEMVVADEMQFIRVGMRRNGASVKLKLRWDNSPRTCELVGAALPIEGDMWHAKYANHEIYILLPVVEIFGEDPPGEWQ